MLDARATYEDQSREKGMVNGMEYMEREFGAQDMEFADDTELFHTNLFNLRIFSLAFLTEARYYGLEANNEPPDFKSKVCAINSEWDSPVLKDLDGVPFRVEATAKTLGIVYGHGFKTGNVMFRKATCTMLLAMNK